MSETLVSKHLTALQLGFHNNIYTYTLNTKSRQRRSDDILAPRRLITTVYQDFMKFRTNLAFIFPVPKGHVISLPGQALNMQNTCTFGNHKNTQLPGEFKIKHAFLEL